MAQPARAQEKVKTIPFEGPQIFAHILHSQGVKPIKGIDETADDPEGSAIIFLGNTSNLQTISTAAGALNMFLKAGGNLFIATDYPLLTLELPVHISGTLQVEQPEAQSYHGNVHCPWLRYHVSPGPEFPTAADHPLFRFLNKGIATNCPSHVFLRKTTQQVQPLLWYKDATMMTRTGDRREAAGNPAYYYMAGSPKGAPPSGRQLYIAGHGMFMNGMMLQGDNDNFAFTHNAVRWITEGPGGSKRRVLFVVDGRVITDFDMNLTPTPPIPMPTKAMINRFLRGLEEERRFHIILENAMGRHAAAVVAVLFVILTVLAAGYGAKKLLNGRHRFEAAVPALVGVPAPLETSAALEARQQSLLRQSEFGPEARDLALEWFRREFDVTPDQWHAGVQANFEANGWLWSRWRLRRQAEHALSLARAAQPGRVSRHRFFALIESLQELSAARKAGRLALLVEGKNVRQ